jgi:MFS family permease
MEVLPEVIGQSGLLTAPAQSPGTPSLALDGQPIPAPALRTVLRYITCAWIFGSVWQMTITSEPVTLFAQKLGASNFQFGLLTALPFIASLLSVVGSVLVELTGRRKSLFLSTLYPQRAMWLVIGLVPLWMITRGGWGIAPQSLSLFLWMVFAMYAVGCIGGPAWTCWMADVVPPRINGKFFSRRRQWGNVTAIPAAVFVGFFLDRISAADSLSTLRWCAILFIACAFCGLADIHLFSSVPAISAKPADPARVLQNFKSPLTDRPFLLFSTYTGILTFANNLLGQFATLFLLDHAGASNMATQLIVVVAPMIGQLLVLGVWGRAADRTGKKPLLIIASAGLIPVALAWCFVGPRTLWLGYILSGLGAALWAAVEVSNLNLILEKGRSQGRDGGSSFVAVNTVIINFAGCLGGLTAGGIAQVLGGWHWRPIEAMREVNFYDVLFIACALARLAAAVAILPALKERGARSIGETVAFILNAFAFRSNAKRDHETSESTDHAICVISPEKTRKAA